MKHGEAKSRSVQRTVAVVNPTSIDVLSALVKAGEDLLPSTARDLITVVGDGDAMALIRAMPGCKFYVPHEASEKHPLAHVFTTRGWRLFVGAYCGTYFTVPACKKALEAVRNAYIVADYAPPSSMSVNELALKWRLSARRIEYILAHAVHDAAETTRIELKKKDTKTIDMFEF